MKKLTCIISVLLCLLVFCSCGAAPTTKVDGSDTPTPNTEATPTPTPENIAVVGETLDQEGIQITFESIEQYVDTGDFVMDTPAEGNMLIILWFTVKNTTDEDYFVNMYYEDSYCDDLSIDPVMMYFNVKEDTIWGDIAEGKSKRGYLGYEVPNDWAKIEFQYKPLFAGKESKMIFVATPADM